MINISKLYCGKSGRSDELRYPPHRNHKPIVVFNCTWRCNLLCRHCYSHVRNCGKEPELTTEQARRLVDQISDYGCPVLLFSGGEPLLREDLFELIEYAGRKGIRTVLSTNGTLIQDSTAERLAALGVSYVGISLDGPAEFHDDFRQVKGAFAAAVKGIRSCRRAGIPAGIRFTMTADNIRQIPLLFQIAADLDVRRICFYHLIRTGRAEDLAEAVPSAALVREAMDSILSCTEQMTSAGQADEVLTVGNHADGPYLLMRLRRLSLERAADAEALLRRAAGNRIGQNIAAVDWAGRVYPDQFWRSYSLGNILEKPFAQIWENPAEPVLTILRSKNEYRDPRCRRCRWFDLCGGNFRSLDGSANIELWRNEPPCYLTEEEIALEQE
ncbi:MAG TPA: radical SAM protein [Anaerohalosphaeraceae bacterium]|nr:radical SAM protein [Anaerohalosphaeraceae bacterium]HOL89218.1 radical SAM protein [Anaerohalosphaeraceae bacterium]HPP56304.1 radical SAM protein [Anaerohalosphaeraceae bacterium]